LDLVVLHFSGATKALVCHVSSLVGEPLQLLLHASDVKLAVSEIQPFRRINDFLRFYFLANISYSSFVAKDVEEAISIFRNVFLLRKPDLPFGIPRSLLSLEIS